MELWVGTISRNQEPCYCRTSQGQPCANQHDSSETEYKSLPNGHIDVSFQIGTKARGNLQAGELILVRLQLRQNAGRQHQVSQAGVQLKGKCLHHHDPKNRDSKHACQARHRVVDSRGGSDSILINRIHNHGGQRSNRDCHSKSENNYRRKELSPIITPDRGHGEQSETQSDNERADDQRSPCTVAGDKSARPAREREHKQDHGKDRSAGCGRGVALDLNQVQRKQEEENSGSGVQKERKQVCAAEASGFEQRKRERRRGAVVLDKYEGNKTADAKNQTPEDRRTSPTQIKRFDETDNHTSKSQGRKNRTWPVDAPGAGAAALRNPPKRNRHHCGGDG